MYAAFKTTPIRAVRRRAGRSTVSVRSCERDTLPVFQAHPNSALVTLWDVEDVLSVASHFTSEKDADDYCFAQGVHRENALMYYPVVTNLKACYKMPAYIKCPNVL